MRTENVWYAVIKFNIHTLNIPQAYLHEKDTLGEIDLFARDIVSEYETKAAMYMLAVQSRIQSLLVKDGVESRQNRIEC